MTILYGGFIALIIGLLALDLGVFHRKVHVIKTREALGWSAFWISLGLAFSGFIYAGYEHQWFGLGTGLDTMATPVVRPDGTTVYNDGSSAVVKYIAGFFVEKSLAVDNIFVIAMIFGRFAVPPLYQHRVLFWGILGALLMRGAMIAAGVALIVRFQWIVYVFGGFLILTGLKMLLSKESEGDLMSSRVLRFVRRIVPVTDKYDGHHFFVRSIETGARVATPLLLVLVLVEVSDAIFAVDSIPAIFAITTDPFLIFTSNVFAILGLRSLYFALAGMIDRFHYLKVALSFVLVVVGIKMITHSYLKEWLGSSFNFYVLGLVGGIIATGIIASLVSRRPDPVA